MRPPNDVTNFLCWIMIIYDLSYNIMVVLIKRRDDVDKDKYYDDWLSTKIDVNWL